MPKPVTPPLAADAVIEMLDQPGRPIVLIERRHEPLGWALPGGFVNVGETLEQAAVREAHEETGLRIRLQALLGCYSDPHRDPRGHVVSVVYVAQARGRARAGDDAKNTAFFTLNNLPPLAFDHERILADYRRYRATGWPAPLNLGGIAYDDRA